MRLLSYLECFQKEIFCFIVKFTLNNFIDFQGEIFTVRFNPSGEHIASGSFDRTICKRIISILWLKIICARGCKQKYLTSNKFIELLY